MTLPLNGIVSYLCSALLFSRTLTFKQSFELEITTLFDRMNQAEENQRNILDQIRQGIVMFDRETTNVEFANQAAFQFIIAEKPEALQFGRPDELRSSESSEGYDHS